VLTAPLACGRLGARANWRFGHRAGVDLGRHEDGILDGIAFKGRAFAIIFEYWSKMTPIFRPMVEK
jgi:hypothetical protein